MSKRNSAKKTAYFCAIILLVLGMVFGGLQILESTVFYQSQEESAPSVSKTITKDGIKYFPRQDITVIMVLGIDETGPVVSSGSYRNSGEADAVVLLLLDQKDETYSVICLNRDMMVEIPAIGLGGKPAGTEYGQLALSHTYGEGLHDSCENTRNTISGLFGGVVIDHYVSLNMDAIAIVNDAVGGVTVDVVDDFSAVDASIPMGTVKLSGPQALTFVRTRMDVGNQLNITRMTRHEEYMQGLMDALMASLDSSDTFVMELYDQVDEYMVTDCSVNTISGLLSRCSDYTLKEIVSPEGDNILGEEYYEFYADEGKLTDLVLRLFYAPK